MHNTTTGIPLHSAKEDHQKNIALRFTGSHNYRLSGVHSFLPASTWIGIFPCNAKVHCTMDNWMETMENSTSTIAILSPPPQLNSVEMLTLHLSALVLLTCHTRISWVFDKNGNQGFRRNKMENINWPLHGFSARIQVNCEILEITSIVGSESFFWLPKSKDAYISGNESENEIANGAINNLSILWSIFMGVFGGHQI